MFLTLLTAKIIPRSLSPQYKNDMSRMQLLLTYFDLIFILIKSKKYLFYSLLKRKFNTIRWF